MDLEVVFLAAQVAVPVVLAVAPLVEADHRGVGNKVSVGASDRLLS